MSVAVLTRLCEPGGMMREALMRLDYDAVALIVASFLAEQFTGEGDRLMALDSCEHLAKVFMNSHRSCLMWTNQELSLFPSEVLDCVKLIWRDK